MSVDKKGFPCIKLAFEVDLGDRESFGLTLACCSCSGLQLLLPSFAIFGVSMRISERSGSRPFLLTDIMTCHCSWGARGLGRVGQQRLMVPEGSHGPFQISSLHRILASLNMAPTIRSVDSCV